MNFDELKNLIWEIDTLVNNYYLDKEMTIKEVIYWKTLKLNEEIWELNWEILSYFWSQRKEKLENYDVKKLEWEFADVFITLLLLAKNLNIDIEKSFLEKYELVKERLKK